MVATECPRCGGSLRIMAKFGATLGLRCRSCGEAYSQLVPQWFADTIAA